MLIDAEVGFLLVLIIIAVFWRVILRLVLAALGAGILLAVGIRSIRSNRVHPRSPRLVS